MARSALARQPLPLIHVLLVEDSPSDAFVVENMLDGGESAQYVTHHVPTQGDALAALDGQPFGVCLLDLTLPDASGFSALIEIQNRAPDMPVLILTGVKDTALARRAVARGAQDYLLKDEMETAGLARAIDYAIARKRVESELFQRANCDALTGLANREAFSGRLDLALARAGRSGAGVAVLFIDLDRFKPVNDVHGHDAGDEVLKALAGRIRAALRSYDAAARLGGDEFAVLLEGITNPRDAASIAQKIVREIALPVSYRGHSLEVGASVGVAFSHMPVTGKTLLQHADTAMYHAKKQGGGAYRFYAESMHEETLLRLSLEEDLCAAVEAGELRLYYQPCMSPDARKVLGVEALLRWAHPRRGVLFAQEFLPAAETARLMPRIGKWNCQQLKRDIAMWNAHDVPPLGIAVNLSASQLEAADLAAWFSPIAQREFLGRHHLIAEIPESAISPMSDAGLAAITALHEQGVALHLDHFGCSSLPLSVLVSLPFSMVKIDISLIRNLSRDMPEGLLIDAAIMLAHHLGLKAAAVGIEAPWQAALLKERDCDMFQGHLSAQPMTAERLVEWLKKSPRE